MFVFHATSKTGFCFFTLDLLRYTIMRANVHRTKTDFQHALRNTETRFIIAILHHVSTLFSEQGC